MIAAALMAMVVAGTVPGAGLDVTSVDASAHPTVVIDFVVAEPEAAADLTPDMVDVDGAPVDALVPGTPTSTGESPVGSIAIALEIAMVGFVSVWLVLRWRRRRRHRRDKPVTSPQPSTDREAETSAPQALPARAIPQSSTSRPHPARTPPTRTMSQPQSARRSVAVSTSGPEPGAGDDAGTQADPVPAVGGSGTSPVSSKPRPKRTPKPKPAPAVEGVAAASKAADEPPPKPKPKRTPTPKPAVDAVVAATDAAEAPVPAPRPKPKRKPRPKPQPTTVTGQDKESIEVCVPEPEADHVPVATATREPIVDQTPADRSEPEPIVEAARQRRPGQPGAAKVTMHAADKPEHLAAREVPPARAVRRRAERPSASQRPRRGARRGPESTVAAGESSVASDWLVVGDLRFRPANGEVWAGRNRVDLTPSELAILELLMAGGNRGVAEADIIVAGGLEPDGRDIVDTLARIRRKTGLSGRGQTVRRERVMLYFLDGDVDGEVKPPVSRHRARSSLRR